MLGKIIIKIIINSIMKKIGIIGGLSAESSIEYYKIIVKEYNKIKGGAASPLLVIDSLDLEAVTKLVAKGKWGEIKEIIFQSARNLESAGAEVIIIATNTIHKVFYEVEEKINVPMISIIEATAESIQSMGLKKIGLLGTKYTMQSDFYQNVLLNYDIETIVPSQEDQEIVNQIIFDELTYHILTPKSKKRYLEVINRLHEEGAEGVILGCTEIPLLIKQEDSPIPVFDTTTIHAIAALKFALN
jgi:aspartate racemase